MNKRPLYILSAFLFFSGCLEPQNKVSESDISDQSRTFPDNITIDSELILTEKLIFKDTDEITLGTIKDLAIDSQSNVYIGETNIIHVFSNNGIYINSIGGEGNGPGEFLNIIDLQIRNKSLFVQDSRQQRIHQFSTNSFEYLQGINLNDLNLQNLDSIKTSYPDSYFLIHDDSLLYGLKDRVIPTHQSDRFIRFFKMSKNGVITSDQVITQKVSPVFASNSDGFAVTLTLPFSKKEIITVSDFGTIYKAWTGKFVIEKYDLNGKYLKSFQYPFEKTTLEKEKVLNDFYTNPRIRKVVSSAEFPETWPVLNELLTDDENRLWVSAIVEDLDIYEWWVLDENGEVLTKFEWPRNKPIKEIRNSAVYTLETDPETGLQQVVSYVFELEVM